MKHLARTDAKSGIKKWALAALVLIPALTLGSCKKDEAEKQEATVSGPSEAEKMIQEAKGKENVLVFFLNPHGAPCQNQDMILKNMQSRVASKVKYVYVSVDDMANRSLFYQYGVRALPTLVILDKSGSPATSFPPGIQSEETLLREIHKLP